MMNIYFCISAEVTIMMMHSVRRFSSRFKLPPIQLDMDYLLNPDNRESIKSNIKHRKGVGDIDSVLESRNDEFRLLKNALKIPNKTHENAPEKDDLILEERKLPWRPLEQLSNDKIRPFDELARISDGLYNQNLTHFTGDKTYYLLDSLAHLERALIEFTARKLTLKEGFGLVGVPDILPAEVLERCGVGVGDHDNVVYRVDDARRHDLALSGTAEMALCGLVMGARLTPDKHLKLQQDSVPKTNHNRKYYKSQKVKFRDFVEKSGLLPSKLASVSRCFRAEAALPEKCIYRVHQFTKVEMFAAVKAEESDETLRDFLRIEKDLFSSLELSYKVLEMSMHELGAPAFRKFDIEAYFPGKRSFGEVSSCSDCSDFQARRLDLKNSDNGEFCHTVNGTACAIPRMIMAIMEQNQLHNGLVKVPDVLVDFMPDKADRIKPLRHRNRRPHFRFIKSPKFFVNKTEKS